jgi:hypothetical protein
LDSVEQGRSETQKIGLFQFVAVFAAGHCCTDLRFSHGGNTGSNPVGDANKIKYLLTGVELHR